MAIALALLRFYDLGSSVTPTFLFRNKFYLQLSPPCPKMSKKSTWEVEKNISAHWTWNPTILRLQGGCKAAARGMKLWSLNANLFFKEPQQFTKFT